MSVSVLPRDSVGPPSLDYYQERQAIERTESSKMEKGKPTTDELMESLIKNLQGLNVNIPPQKAVAPKKVAINDVPKTMAMDDVDGLLGRGVDQPGEHDWTNYNYSGSSYSPSSHSMSPMYQPSPSSSGYGPQSPQSFPQFSPRSQTSPCTSMKSTGSSEHLYTGSPGSPSQSASSLSSSLSMNQRMPAPPVTANIAVTSHSTTASTQGYGFDPVFNGFSSDVLLRENPPSLSSHSSSSNRSSGGSDDMNMQQRYVRGVSVLDDFLQVTAQERAQTDLTEFAEQPAFLGEQPVQVPDGHITLGTLSSVPPPHAKYQPHQAAMTQSASQEMLEKKLIMDFLKSPSSLITQGTSADLETDNAAHGGYMNSRADGLFPMPEPVQVVPDHGSEFLTSSDFVYQQVDFPDQLRPPYFSGPKSLPLTSFAPQPVRQQTPAVPPRQPLIPPRQPQVSSRPQTVQTSLGANQLPTVLAGTSGVRPMQQPPAFRSLPTPALGKRAWEGEVPGPRKTLKREWSQYFDDPEDTDLHVLAELKEEDMNQRMDFIENFVLSCCQDQLDAFNMEKKTPLYVAVGNLNFKMVKLLLQKGARTDIMSSDKNRLANEQKIEQPVLHLACEKGSLEMVSMFVAHGADVNSARFCDGRLTPLMVAVQKYATESEHRSDFEKIVLFLIRNNANLAVTEKLNKKTALMMAVETGEARLIQLMLEEIGAGRQARELINLPNGQGNTCLHIAAGRQNQTPQERSALMEILVKFGGDNNAKNREGYTPNDLGGRAPMKMISSSIQQRMNVSQSRAAIPNLAQINNCM